MKLFKSPNFRVLKLAKPVVFTVFINKVGAIGLAVVPILLVEKHIPTDAASGAMTVMRSALIIGTLCAGWFVDRFGSKLVILISLLMSAVGLGLLPIAPTAMLIAVFGALAQLGESLTRIALRAQMTRSVPFEDHKEAFGWFRMAANIGQVFSFSVGALAGSLGTAALFLFDSLTSFAAFFYGFKILPEDKPEERTAANSSGSAKRPEHFSVFVAFAVIFGGYLFFYELYAAVTAGKLELVHPGKGLRIFSICMVINTIICTVLAVPAAKYLRRPSRVIPVSILATFAAFLFSVLFTDSLALVFLGAFLYSAAEASIMTFTTLALVRLTPASKNSTSWYSFASTFVQLFRILSAAIAFPWFIQNSIQPVHCYVIGLACAVMIGLTFSVRRAIDRATS